MLKKSIYMVPSFNISLTVGCGNTVRCSCSTVSPFVIAMQAAHMNSLDELPSICTPRILPAGDTRALKMPVCPSFSATKRPA